MHTRALRPGVRWGAIAFIAALIVLWFGFLGLRALYFPDEGRYAEIPREMLASGDLVTPRLNGFPYFEKPPLQYWLTAGTFAAFGESAFTARVAPALAGFAAALAVLLTVRRVTGRRAGWMAGAMMAGSIGFFLSAQFVTLDMMLSAILCAALCAFLLAQHTRATAAEQRQWMRVAWALCGLAVLTKGLIGLVLPMLAVGVYMMVARDWALLRRLHLVEGIGIVALVTAPWFILVESRNPGFADFFFIREHWQRFTEPGHRRTGPLLYFVPIAIGYLSPWVPALAVALAAKRRSSALRVRAFSPTVFAWCWAVAIFVFFSVSSSKLPAYVMPALAGAAVAGGIALARCWSRTVRITAWTIILLGIAVAAGAVPAADAIKVELVAEQYESSVAWIVASGALLIVGGALALVALRARRRLAALAVIVIGVLAACQAGLVVAHRVEAYFSAAPVLEQVTKGVRPFHPELPFYSVDFFDQTVPFYLGRTVILVKEKSEVDWGIERAPANYIEDVATFAQRWRDGGDAYAVMRTSTYDFLKSTGLPMRVLGEDGRRVVVARS